MLRKWKGVVKGGAVILEEPLPLPDGTPVFIVPETEERNEPVWEADPFLRVDEWLPKLDVPLPSDWRSGLTNTFMGMRGRNGNASRTSLPEQ